jgi:CDGSH-type Zn-finger protein
LADSENPKIYRNPKSGSMRFTGTADFVDSEGNFLERRTDFKLCGCGRSKEAPFCDGSHKELQ